VKILGISFIALSSAAVGFQMSAMLRKRCALMRELDNLLQLLEQEIVTCGTPLPHAFALLSASTDGIWENVFSGIAKEMDKNRWATPHEAAQIVLNQVHDRDISEIMLPMMKKMGKYNIEAQTQGIESARRQLRMILQELEQERKMKSKTFQTLGICTGLAVAILLI